MGVYALARRANVTSRSQPRPVDGRRLPAWEVHLTPDHFVGRQRAEVHPIDDETLPFGTQVVFDDDSASMSDVGYAVQYFPLPVTCDGTKFDRWDFVDGALHVEEWRGIRLGVYMRWYDVSPYPRMNFHGIRIDKVHLPHVASMDNLWELVLPARKRIVETPFVDQLRSAFGNAIYRGMLAAYLEVDVLGDVCAEAEPPGVELPVPRAALWPWKPRYADRYANERSRPGGPHHLAREPDRRRHRQHAAVRRPCPLPRRTTGRGVPPAVQAREAVPGICLVRPAHQGGEADHEDRHRRQGAVHRGPPQAE